MKIKIKDQSVLLPNAWKQCGLSKKDWDELQSGKTVDATSISESIKNLVDIKESTSKPESKISGGK